MNEEIKKFIINKIDNLSEDFPKITFTYGFDITSMQHIIEVEPDSEYRNKPYMLAEFEFINEFINVFPDEDILFISNDRYIKIKEPIYVKYGIWEIESAAILFSGIAQINTLIDSPINMPENTFLSKNMSIEIMKPQFISRNQHNNPASIEISIKEDYALAA